MFVIALAILDLLLGPSGTRPPTTPLRLIENRGQFDCDAKFVASLPDLLVRAETRSLGIQLFAASGDANIGTFVRLDFEGASDTAKLVPEDPGETTYSWFLGNDSSRWARGLKSYGRLRYQGLWAGVDLVLHEDRGLVKYDLELAPGADIYAVQIHTTGTESVSISPQGILLIQTAQGCLTQAQPLAFEVSNLAGLRPVPCR